jgi:hypothetical protein
MYGLVLFNETFPQIDRFPVATYGMLVPLMTLEGWWPTQARFWLEWGSSTAGQSVPAARSRFRAVHSDSISTRPSDGWAILTGA